MDFLRLMFRTVQSRFPQQPDIRTLTSISLTNAIFTLQECSGMKRDRLGKRLGLTRAKMIHLETYGKANAETITKLQLIAEEYGLNVLAEYFRNQAVLVQAHRRKMSHQMLRH